MRLLSCDFPERPMLDNAQCVGIGTPQGLKSATARLARRLRSTSLAEFVPVGRAREKPDSIRHSIARAYYPLGTPTAVVAQQTPHEFRRPRQSTEGSSFASNNAAVAHPSAGAESHFEDHASSPIPWMQPLTRAITSPTSRSPRSMGSRIRYV